ncbi:hypothetical protein GGR22_002741 [Flavobacterium gossypii]|uniref:Shedu protein SduA C-terminal domain-containing protein n=1 Tax=Flavobacterium gossypii TaxID=1646119 RepID=A0ABR6DS85_9FLAO|nr:Shedu immune nuclease family protein [Flavobacterium gossypii]MBA9074568.1 hypothetical protein [Flavobacterium gossypii]
MEDDNPFKEFEYFTGKVPNKTYVSKRISSKKIDVVDGELKEVIIPIRYASKVVDVDHSFEFIKEKGEVKLRISGGHRQEITAKFLEDSRGIFTLQIQKYTTATGMPHKTYFSFRGDELKILQDFIKNIFNLQIEDENKFSISDSELAKLTLTKQQAYTIYKENREIFSEILENKITEADIKNLVYKKAQLEIFEKLLTDEEYFIAAKSRLDVKKDEALWQLYFEQNSWIFGYGLDYIINVPLQDKKLEQVVQGYDIVNRGKRIDALMKSRGIISSLCFAEIKTPNTKLLNAEYRPAVFPPSNEVVGGITQIQKTVQNSLENLVNKITPSDKSGNPTGEEIFMYKPKSFLLIGKLEEFQTEFGVNKEKFSSFEIFRKSINDIEIITFDELLERAKFIVYNAENS